MVSLYKYLIEMGSKKFSDVPTLYHNQLREAFKADVESGKITKEQYQQYTGEAYPEPPPVEEPQPEEPTV